MLDLLVKITKVSFLNLSKVDDKIKANGEGEVRVKLQDNNNLIFEEKLQIVLKNNQKLNSSNVYIWTLADSRTLILERIRYEDNAALFSLKLEKISDKLWQTREANICGKDHYTAKLEISNNHCFELIWNIVGENKAETSIVKYS